MNSPVSVLRSGLVGMIFSLVSSSSWAQTPSDEEVPETKTEQVDAASQRAYQGALRLVAEKRYLEAREALVELLRGGAPPPEAHYALGQTELALGRPCEALASYRTYLQHSASIPAVARQRIRHHIQQLSESGFSEQTCDKRESAAQLELSCAVPGARASLDGDDVPLSPGERFEVSPGTHQVIFQADGRSSTPLSVEVSSGSTVVVQCSESIQPPPAAPPVEARAPRFNRGQKTGLFVAGAGLAAGAASLSLYLWNLGRYQAWKGSADYRNAFDEEIDVEPSQEFLDLKESIDRVRRVNVGVSIVASVLAVTGVTLFVVQTQKRKKNERKSIDTAGFRLRATPLMGHLSYGGTF